jgi:hypothetical protein
LVLKRKFFKHGRRRGCETSCPTDVQPFPGILCLGPCELVPVWMLFPWVIVPWLMLRKLFGLASFIGSFKLWVTRSFLYILHDDDRDLYLEWLLD